ncbi:hypothetical protein Moror_17262 [Moniliophthora roreri MCA 2997]|uniref:F-box domain-containing protein n=2 Tax=Moniliophthora roreri TaxID=221103 RepID=V2XF58_MONRO|nr:hypothetical protein Moror_17262 [Moniliophthora roreri MCA 2997]KAI3602632.1 hypothetical protein WG66_009301 [Moniliophthora roreri]
MVTADNLNLDVLDLIFCHLPQQDLPSTALVSRSFFVGAIPRLYGNIIYSSKHAKRYPRVMTPFCVIMAHPWLATHVKHIEIRVVPKLKIEATQFHSIFLSQCTAAMNMCTNLLSFKCVKPILPMFLKALQGKERLQELRVHATLTTLQAEMLSAIKSLQSLALDSASWNVIDMLPKWAPNLSPTLTNLVIYMSSDLNELILEQMLRKLPGLIGLHVVGCPKVDHHTILRLASHTPHLESLSFSTTETSNTSDAFVPELSNLRHLGLDTRYSTLSSPAPIVLSSILKLLRSASPALTSFVMRVPEVKAVGRSFIEQLVKDYAQTLKQVSFLDCGIEMDSIVHICSNCELLERLELPIPLKELIVFTAAIGRSNTLRTVVDTNAHGADHHQSLGKQNAEHLMKNVPSLNKIVSDKRVWTRRHLNEVAFENLSSHTSASYWFLPRQHD